MILSTLAFEQGTSNPAATKLAFSSGGRRQLQSLADVKDLVYIEYISECAQEGKRLSLVKLMERRQITWTQFWFTELCFKYAFGFEIILNVHENYNKIP